jgi:hypothetical protein
MSFFTPLRAILIAALALGVLTGAGYLAQREVPEVTTVASSIEPIRASVLLCPEPGTSGDRGVRVSAAVVPIEGGQSGAGQSGDGRVVLETLEGKESARARITEPGAQTEIPAQGRSLPAVRVVGIGSLAPGLIADQWSRDPRGKGRGMASTACEPAASEFWFVGGGAIPGRASRIVLINPDDQAAVVDLVIYGPDGIVEAPAGRGLVVKPGKREVIGIDELAPGITTTAVHVIVRTGRIGASIDDDQMSGLDTIGTEWVPQSEAPAKLVYVPGVMPGPGARVLAIAAPGEDDAIVGIRVISKLGTFAPADRDTVTVPAGSVVSLDMSAATGEEAVTLELTSDNPIVAGMRQFFGDKTGGRKGKKVQQETAYAAGRHPFAAMAAVSGLPVRPNTEVRLAITAPQEPVSVDLTILPFAGKDVPSVPTQPKRIDVPAGQVAWILLPEPPGASWFSAVVTPRTGSGPMLLSHRVREKSEFGDLVTGYPWWPLRTQVRVPTAGQDPSVTVR